MRGFTLIELLVVIVIISITVTFASFAVVHSLQQRQLKVTAETLNTLLSAAQQQAILQSTTLGLRVEKNSYTFYQWKSEPAPKGQWQPLTQDRLLGYHALDNSLSFVIKNKVDSEGGPQIIFYPGGEMTPFIFLLTLKNNSAAFQFQGQANGEIHYKKLISSEGVSND